MDGVFLSQVASLEAPQLEMDKTAQSRVLNQSGQVAQEGVFKAVLEKSMQSVHETFQTESKNPLLQDEEEKDDSEE